MRINKLVLDGFRNYNGAESEFSPGMNIVVGQNAQGKTNLLEAAYFLTHARSFRTRINSDLIGFDREQAFLGADVFSSGREQRLEARLFKNGRKQLTINGVKQATAADFSGKLAAVLFCPEDLYIVKEGPTARRRLMDAAISQLRPRYAVILSEFTRLCRHKTRILRDWREKPSLLEPLPEYNRRIAEMGAQLIYYRAAWTEKLERSAKIIHSDFSGVSEALDISYKTVSTVGDARGLRPAQLLPMLLEHQASHTEAERAAGMILTGAHKDDLEIRVNGLPAKTFASQGQTRTAALSIKLAERELCHDDTGQWPVLLLDDVLSELDFSRRDFVLNRVRDGQVIISCCDGGEISQKTGGRVIRVEKGMII